MSSIYSQGKKISFLKYLFPFKGTDSTSSSPYEVFFPKGKYFIELFGASGGCQLGGPGGVSTGFLTLKSDRTLFLYVGGSGITGTSSGCINGGWNGGGMACSENYHCSGGGSTDIRLSENTGFNERIFVSGGGGGSACSYYTDQKFKGGYGGTETGESAYGYSGRMSIAYGNLYSNGGSQTSGGTGVIKTYGRYTNEAGSWGKGGKCAGGNCYCGAGGGGYYGGAGGYDVTPGGGGSSYFDPSYISNASLLTGNVGNGKIIITIIKTNICTRRQKKQTRCQLIMI